MTANPATVWTPEEIAKLRELHAQVPSLSYTEIARELGRKRNACIGKAHRLKLPDRSEMRNHGRPRSAPIRRRGPVSPARLEAAALQRAAYRPRVDAEAFRPVLLDGSDGCRWPTGDHPFVSCAAPVVKGQVYCGEHCRLAYRPRKAA